MQRAMTPISNFFFSHLNSGIQEIVVETFNIISEELTRYAERINFNFSSANRSDLQERFQIVGYLVSGV
ncbi:hypothetical protein EYZ11_008994 [Aspergillus tanneri]|uniref:Uncharacterized protein n=1 Tax=Aspergillus tanneri TaxID=1220188 RepID=A0A4V3UNK7_9EURO|nr:hypothetical protein EYZ11_008994 [Aspergillus tanneri]